jgi:hypothetical protein
MDRVSVDLLDDDYVATEGEDAGPDLARAPTEVGVRYLVGLGMAEMDARHLVAISKGRVPRDVRAADELAPESPSP